ncbi:MAG: heavy-metal-associated domain-containing protein [Nitrososphaeria archaeon]
MNTEEKKVLSLTLPVLGLDCFECSKIIKKKVGSLRGVQRVEVNYMLNMVTVDFDQKAVTRNQIEKTIEDAGYRLAYRHHKSIMDKFRRFTNRRLNQ